LEGRETVKEQRILADVGVNEERDPTGGVGFGTTDRAERGQDLVADPTDVEHDGTVTGVLDNAARQPSDQSSLAPWAIQFLILGRSSGGRASLVPCGIGSPQLSPHLSASFAHRKSILCMRKLCCGSPAAMTIMPCSLTAGLPTLAAMIFVIWASVAMVP